MLESANGIAQLVQHLGVALTLGLAFILLLRLAERLVLLPAIGFVFSILFFALEQVLSLAAWGSAAILFLIGFGSVVHGVEVKVSEVALFAGIGLLYATINSTWADLLEARKAKRQQSYS